ncbi:hypothetical protein O0L34_g16490 [Tuta absoluta]|nr:hypothetical protein O0L34_g16490 [Tuta absoluta]
MPADEPCDCADVLERRLRLDNAADGQFPETSGWAALLRSLGGGCGGGPDKCPAASDPGAGKRSTGTKRSASTGSGNAEGELCKCNCTCGPSCAGLGGGAQKQFDSGQLVCEDICEITKPKTAADVLIPIIGGGLIFLGLFGLIFKYYGFGSTMRAKIKCLAKQVLDLLCDPQVSALPGTGVFVNATCKPKVESSACGDTFTLQRQNRNKDACGSRKIDPDKRKYPQPPSAFEFPVIPGLHDCSDDEDFEEGVFKAPGSQWP